MIETPPLPRRTPFNPADTSPCLCGSGQSFLGCCANHLPGGEIRKKALIAADRGDWTGALAATRADVAQYSIWHITNTAPLLRADPDPADRWLRDLLDIDVGALSDYVQMMCDYCTQTGAHADVPAILERLRSNIDHDRWRRRILYLHCLNTLSEKWDDDAARREFRKLGSMAEESDVQILQLYLDLHGRDLGLSELLNVIDRIVELCDDDNERLHYRALKATSFLMAGDAAGARRELTKAIDLYRSGSSAASRTLHGRQLFATSLRLAGTLGGDDALLEEAELEIRHLLALTNWTPRGRADLLRQRGDIHRQNGDWHSARDSYSEAWSTAGQAIDSVFVAQCVLFAEGAAPAASAIALVDSANLDREEYVDYVITLAQIAIEGGQAKLLRLAEDLLRILRVDTPFFKRQCDALLVSVIDTAKVGPTAERSSGVRRLLSSFLFGFTRYVKLEPNYRGIGLNLGKMIDDANERYLKPASPPLPPGVGEIKR